MLVLGLDGLDPGIVERMWSRGDLPHLRGLREAGGSARLATTLPAQTPVAWSTFATGVNPGGHGIFDFVTRDRESYRPVQALARYERRSAFLPPRAVNRRRGTPVWELLSRTGLPSTILRCPCTYPPDEVEGRILAGMGVPDLRGGFGTSTYYTTDPDAVEKESERLIRIPGPVRGEAAVPLHGPRDPKGEGDVSAELRLVPTADGGLRIRSDGEPGELVVEPGRWSDWLKLSFRVGLLQSVGGMVRFHLSAPPPDLRLYVSPVNFDPRDPPYPISRPTGYAAELERTIGTYHTAGMVEDHTGLSNDRFSEDAYLRQCGDAFQEREAMLTRELERFREGLLYCLFDTPDRIQHMFWRYREPDHPANRDRARSPGGERVIEDHYRECDALVGRVRDRLDPEALLIVLSDHGFGSFRRGLHLNRWLHDRGLLAFRDGGPGRGGEGFPERVEWGRTSAYAVGLGGIFLNLRGREAEGIVAPEEAPALRRRIARELAGTADPDTGRPAVRGAVPREAVYRGPFAEEAPDVLVRFAPGYRASWATALGGAPPGLCEDNVRRWAGDHIVDPASVPGLLLMSHPFDDAAPRMVDLAPTILAALGVEPAPVMEGRSLLP